ncbi:MAG: ribonuclease P protein component [Deltaproteobacteria bacterium]|nr:ribonuclease P protein component [Deltaproteobacteria bacterium]
MSGQKLTKRERINRSPEIRNIRVQGERFAVGPFQVSRKSNEKGPRLAIAITRRAGPSVSRNRVKRKLRELFRKNKETFGCYDYFFFINRPVTALKEQDWKKNAGSIKEWCLKK